jgi:hypothetical protein
METSQESNLSQKKQDDPHDDAEDWILQIHKERKENEINKQRRKSNS